MEHETTHETTPESETETLSPDEPAVAPAPDGGEAAPDGQPVGADNIREGKVRGVMGGPNQSQGQGQGG